LLGAAPFAVINSDVWTDYPLAQLRRIETAGAHLVLIDNPSHHPLGDFHLAAGGRLSEHGEGPQLTFAGLSVLHPAIFGGCEGEVFPLKPLLTAAMAAGTASGEHYRGQWLDVGTPQRLRDAEALARG